MSSKEVLPALRGKIIHKPAIKKWYPTLDLDACVYNAQAKEGDEYAYTVEKETEWTPYNSNLHMQGIKVLVKDPVPAESKKGGSVEDTLLLLDMLKNIKQKDKEAEKAKKIHNMAMAQKKKMNDRKNV
eukprot:TRINITY_DN7554_c0_g1_i1.p1 TRINITY_DN7554_c0_g1~~TRINITY_DN7554_c0_g1_i1.p1  ORF type:complete len:128 (+),score=41.77 TRINITY_DN7554_c0_g1_i1:72-455(+)